MSVALSVASPARYTLLARAFHWSIALLMAGMFATIWLRGFTERDTPMNDFWIHAHMSLGILVFLLALLRLLTRPPAPAIGTPLEQRAKWVMHRLLMLATLLVPVMGFLRVTARGRAVDFFGNRIPSLTGEIPGLAGFAKAMHGDLMQDVLLVLIGLHVAAALFHQYVLKNDVMRRML